MEGRRRGLAGGEGGFGKEIRVSRGNLIFLAARVRVLVLVLVLVAWRGRWVDVLDPFPCSLCYYYFRVPFSQSGPSTSA
jgi:hypothetical protein